MVFRGRLPSCLATQEPRSVGLFQFAHQGQRERCYDPCPPVLSYPALPSRRRKQSSLAVKELFIYRDTFGMLTRLMESRWAAIHVPMDDTRYSICQLLRSGVGWEIVGTNVAVPPTPVHLDLCVGHRTIPTQP